MTATVLDLESARRARGVRLVVTRHVPSPWTEAAKALFAVKGIAAAWVAYHPKDEALRAWTGVQNVPVAFYDDEPPRTGWAEILALAERLGGACSLIPTDLDQRARMFGLANELCGEGGLGWCGRLVMVQLALESEGRRSFPVPFARYLARKYGYTPERAGLARGRIREILAALGRELRAARAAGGRYLMGAELTALDLYLATFLAPFAVWPEDQCRMEPTLRPGHEALSEEMGGEVPRELVAHRDFIYERHLALPIVL